MAGVLVSVRKRALKPCLLLAPEDLLMLAELGQIAINQEVFRCLTRAGCKVKEESMGAEASAEMQAVGLAHMEEQ